MKNLFRLFISSFIAFCIIACDNAAYTNPDDPTSPEALNMDIRIEVSDITATSALIVFTPQYTNVEYFYDIMPKEMLNDVDGKKMSASEYIKWRIDNNRQEGASYDYYKQYVAYHTGRLELTMFAEGEGLLEPETEYFICAYTIDAGLNLASPVAVEEFETLSESEGYPQPVPDNYVDLNLPSGTLWAKENVGSVYFTYTDARNEFGNALPTKEQWQELINNCQWTWDNANYGYLVKGKNGKTIFLDAFGYLLDDVVYDNELGYYWSRTEVKEGMFTYVYYMAFHAVDKYFNQALYTAPAARSVRLVYSK